VLNIAIRREHSSTLIYHKNNFKNVSDEIELRTVEDVAYSNKVGSALVQFMSRDKNGCCPRLGTAYSNTRDFYRKHGRSAH